MSADAARLRVLQALQRGEDATAALDALQSLAPRDPQTLYLRGLAALVADDLATARDALADAAARLPDDAAVQANWALCLQRRGEHAAALVAADRVVALAPAHADGHYNRALVLAALGRNDAAMAALERALALAPAHGQAWLQLGRLALARGAFAQAEAALARARALRPDDAGVLVQHAHALRRLDRADAALAACDRAIALVPGHAEARKTRGLLHQSADALAAAADDFAAAAALRFAPGRDSPYATARVLRRTSRAKLRHDIEQFAHLERHGTLPQAGALRALHVRALAQLPPTARDAQAVDLPDALLHDLDGHYNRLHHLADAPRLPGGALSPTLDGAAIERDYAARAPGITWIDGLLRPDALAALRRYCLDSTFWFDFEHANGYLGTFFEDGFTAPLLLQIAEDLRALLPGLLRGHALTQLWAFKYDSTLDGIELHADIAAVNVNFWITPDEANLDPAGGGLVVWDREAPADWGLDEFNTSSVAGQARIRRFLEDGDAKAVRVPYRENRAVMFNSDLFHRTDAIRFRDGYADRRINVTMLFGERQGRMR